MVLNTLHDDYQNSASMKLHASLEIRGETERIVAMIKYRYVQISNTIGNQI